MADITIKTSDGGSMGAYQATPASGKGPVVVVIQEIFGVNPWVRSVADRYAQQGFIAIAPDLFWRIKPGVQLNPAVEAEFKEAFGLMGKFDFDKGVGDIQAAISHGRKAQGGNGKVGAVGFCLGGSLAYATACMTDSNATAGYYPVQIEGKLDYAKNIKNPLALHVAENDAFCPPEAQNKIKDALKSNPKVAVYSYPGVGHGFARDGSGDYNKPAADQANARTLELFKKNLA
jgi:carboxymethylenebutenolidase